MEGGLEYTFTGYSFSMLLNPASAIQKGPMGVHEEGNNNMVLLTVTGFGNRK